MLTVIIAEKHIIEQYKQNEMLLSPFDKSEAVFCEWNSEGGSIEEMLPDLKKIISFNTNWRAVIVTENNKDSVNPFDVVGYSDYINKATALKFNDEFLFNCKKMFECYDESVKNPLTKLSSALCETPYFAELIDADIESLTQSKKDLLQFIFKSQVKSVNAKRFVSELKRFKEDKLSLFVGEKNIQDFISAMARKDFDAVFGMLPEDKLIPFLEFANLGNCAVYDPGYWFALFENTKKAQLYQRLKQEFRLRCPLPQDVMCVALRTFDMQIHNSKVAWDEKNESNYTDFVRYNLYNENIRFLIYDIPSEQSENRATEILKFHILLQVLAMHGNSAFSIAKNKVYQVDLKYNRRELNRTIARLVARLRATAMVINEEIFTLKSKKPPELDNKTARLVFETDVRIPVNTDKEYVTSNLMADYDIGLSCDCPRDEMSYWAEQYENIKKLFKRFLREPRRAVKKACTEDFRNSNKITDMRAIGLNENQKEDILIKLEEEEQNMVSTTTSAIYNTSKFNQAIEEADKEIRRGIRQRMTKKKTVLCGVFAVLCYFVGFLPLIFSNVNTVKSFVFSVMITAAVIVLFSICGLIYLFVLKKRMVNRFKHFNFVMSGICSEIRDSLTTFSKYLSHACMVMREKSVLNLASSKETEDLLTIRVLRYNLAKLEDEIEKNYNMLTDFSDEDVDDLLSFTDQERIMPFDYDYTKRKEFRYSLFEEEISKDIEYMLKGHTVQVPMACIEEVTLKREELYD